MSARSTALTRSAHNRPMNSRRFMQPDPIDNRKNWDIGGGDVHSTPEANMSTQTNGSGTDPSKSKLGHNPSILFCGRHPPTQTVRLSRPPCASNLVRTQRVAAVECQTEILVKLSNNPSLSPCTSGKAENPTRHVITMPCGAPGCGSADWVNRPWATWKSAPRAYMMKPIT